VDIVQSPDGRAEQTHSLLLGCLCYNGAFKRSARCKFSPIAAGVRGDIAEDSTAGYGEGGVLLGPNGDAAQDVHTVKGNVNPFRLVAIAAFRTNGSYRAAARRFACAGLVMTSDV